MCYLDVWPLSCSSRDNEHAHTDGVDVRLVAREGLPAHAVPDVPQFDWGVAGSRHKCTEVGRQGQAHDITGVARENRGLLTCLDVPQCTGTETQKVRTEICLEKHVALGLRLDLWHSPCGVSWTCDDLIVVNETATRQVTCEKRVQVFLVWSRVWHMHITNRRNIRAALKIHIKIQSTQSCCLDFMKKNRMQIKKSKSRFKNKWNITIIVDGKCRVFKLICKK